MASDEAKAAAVGLVNAFRTREGGVWTTVAKGPLADGLIARINDPTKISSAASQLCGSAAVINDLASREPSTYAQLGIDLFEKGEGKVKSLTIKPSGDLRKTPIPAGNDPADWVVLASLRDSENWLFTYHGDGRWKVPFTDSSADDAKAIQLPHTVEKWFREFGYSDVKNVTNLLFTKDWDDVKDVDRLYRGGYKVSLFISANMLYTASQGDASTTPDHWVGMASAILSSTIHLDPTATISATVYTWGTVRDVHENPSKKMTVKQFLSNFYGYVAAKP
jgi:hypothetical protein